MLSTTVTIENKHGLVYVREFGSGITGVGINEKDAVEDLNNKRYTAAVRMEAMNTTHETIMLN